MIEFWKEAPPRKVIITPLPALVKAVGKRLKGKRNVSAYGWRSAGAGSYNGRNIFITECGTGQSAGDSVLFLKEKGVREILFAGLAGSLKPELPPGSFCGISGYGGGAGFREFLSLKDGDTIPYSEIKLLKTDDGNLPKAAVYTLPSLFLEKKHFNELARLGFDIIDMETALAAEAAGKDVKLLFLYNISDFRQEFTGLKIEEMAELCLQSA